jgi:DNA invertase Pin-like site-specific DNA recombinase
LKEGEIEVTSSPGWLKSAMLLMFAEWDSRVKSEKVKDGMRKAKNLKKHIGRPIIKRGGQEVPSNHIGKEGLKEVSLNGGNEDG